MLPPHLKRVKESLKAKEYSKRSTAEDQLLHELNALDESRQVRALVARLRESRGLEMTSGPTGLCPCCGR